MSFRFASLAFLAAAVTCFGKPGFAAAGVPAPTGPAGTLIHPQERHVAKLRQLIFGGENTEVSFSSDGDLMARRNEEQVTLQTTLGMRPSE